jgi:transposase
MKGRKWSRKQCQPIPPEQRYTINDFNAEFPDDNACLEYVKEQRWPNGITHCAKCGKDRKHHRVTGRTAYACDYCGNHIYPLAGSIFEKSTTSLRSWFYAMYLMGSTRCGISAKQIQREIGVTYKTAWRMFRQIRTLMSEDVKVEGPTVEMDETYYGGTRKGRFGRAMRGDKHKTPIVGIVERNGGRIIARTTADVTGKTLLGLVKEYVLPESVIFTDEYKSYDGIKYMKDMKYTHRRIKHTSGVYVSGDVHTNTIEGFWSLVKRGIGGVYHYLQSYLNEYAFRYNRRNVPKPMFTSILERISEGASESPAEPIVESLPV